MTMNNSTTRTLQAGFSLLEVMIAVLIFSVGLLGVASLLVIATGADHGAYQRTQVAYLAQSMADRMAANPIGVWNNNYNSSSYPLSVTQSCGSGCTPAQLAVHDQEIWSRQLKTFLPDPSASISCDRTTGSYLPTSDVINQRPPFGGRCQMTITWKDRGFGDSSKRVAADETFAWEFQP